MTERPILFSAPMVRAILDGRKTQTRRVLNPQPILVDATGGGKVWHLKTRTGFANSTDEASWPAWMVRHSVDQDGNVYPAVCPYGAGSDRLWVRETWRPRHRCICGGFEGCDCGDWLVTYAADGAERLILEGSIADEWTCPKAAQRGDVTPLHMPRWASRITLEVTEVCVQRLQDISEEDAKAEGVQPVTHESWTAYDPETDGYPSFGVEPDAEMVSRRRLENIRHHGPKIISPAKEQFRLLWDSINGKRPGCDWGSNPWVWAVTFKRLPPSTT